MASENETDILSTARNNYINHHSMKHLFSKVPLLQLYHDEP